MKPTLPNGSSNRRKFISQILTNFRNEIAQVLPNPSYAASAYVLLTTACSVPGDYAFPAALLIGWLTKTTKN